MGMIPQNSEMLIILLVRIKPKTPNIYFSVGMELKIVMTLPSKVLTLSFYMKLLTVLPVQILLLVLEI